MIICLLVCIRMIYQKSLRTITNYYVYILLIIYIQVCILGIARTLFLNSVKNCFLKEINLLKTRLEPRKEWNKPPPLSLYFMFSCPIILKQPSYMNLQFSTPCGFLHNRLCCCFYNRSRSSSTIIINLVKC